MIRTTIVFDEEDYITPPDAGLDDLLAMLAGVMTAERVSGTFFVIGERLRCLRDRGRSDVIAEIARHDVGSHVNMGSIHPTIAERMEHADWADGVARLAADELGGIDEMESILGGPIRSFARHGGSYAPQLLAALASRSLPYVYSPAKLPGHHITWFCNTLNFYDRSVAFQEAYLSRETFHRAEKRYFEMIEKHTGYDWVAVFQSHPCMIKTKEFWDLNYYRGANPAPDSWRIPAVRPEYDFSEVRSNWALHCRRLREHAGLRVGTIADFSAEFGGQVSEIGENELVSLARRAATCELPFFTERLSAAEILDLLARWYLDRRRAATDPGEALRRREVFGPASIPPAVPTARRLGTEAIERAARGIVSSVDSTRMLPSRVRCGEGTLGSAGEIGTGTALRAIGEALLTPDSNEVTAHIVAPYPAEGEEIAETVRGFRSWPCHRSDLDLSQIVRHTLLQSWTLKPAWPGSPPEVAPE